jgi:hypothetical protein
MVVLKAFDDDHACELDHNQVYSTEVRESSACVLLAYLFF